MATSVVAGTQQFLVDKLHRVGWIIPPYVGVAQISHIAAIIDRSDRSGVAFGLTELERILSAIYSPEMLASMVVDRYPKTPVIEDFQKIIAESVEAHFLKLDHVASSGLVPVVEGATRRLANRNGAEVKNSPARHRTPAKRAIENLIAHCKQHVIAKQIGAVGECLSVLESFEMFSLRVLFADSDRQHPFTDGTNRNGMAHAIFADKDFGSPLNFYKIITAVNVLTWMSALYYGGSGFVPNETPQSVEHARYYQLLSNIASQERPKP
jgi:hypothetical protein